MQKGLFALCPSRPAPARLAASPLHLAWPLSTGGHAGSGALAVPVLGVPALSLAYCLEFRMHFPIDTGVRFPGRA